MLSLISRIIKSSRMVRIINITILLLSSSYLFAQASPPGDGTTSPGGGSMPPGGGSMPPAGDDSVPEFVCYVGTLVPLGYEQLPTCSSLGYDITPGSTPGPDSDYPSYIDTTGVVIDESFYCYRPPTEEELNDGIHEPHEDGNISNLPICDDVDVPHSGLPGFDTDEFDADAFFSQVGLDDLLKLTDEQIRAIDPAAASRFTAEQINKLNPDSIDAIGADLISNLSREAVGGFSAEQIRQLDPGAINGFTADLISNLSGAAVAGFNQEQIRKLVPDVVASLSWEQFEKLDADAVKGFSADHIRALPAEYFSALNRVKIAALDPLAIRAMEQNALGFLDQNEFKALQPQEITRMLVNFNTHQFTVGELTRFMPEGWSLDEATGAITLPAGARVELRKLEPGNLGLPADISLPELPDFSSGLAIGGDTMQGSILQGLDAALDKAGLPGFRFSQDNGILKVGTGGAGGPQLAFIPDTKALVQAPEGAASGLSKDGKGRYVLITPDGLQVTVIPTLARPADLLGAVPGVRVIVDDEGGTLITRPGEKPFLGIADPFLSSSSLSPGIHRSGEGNDETVTVVYPDGAAQILKPMVQNSGVFVTTVSAIPNVSTVTVKADGSVEVMFKGQLLMLAPAFDIEPGAASAGSIVPKIIALGGGAFSFTNANGDVQLLHLK